MDDLLLKNQIILPLKHHQKLHYFNGELFEEAILLLGDKLFVAKLTIKICISFYDKNLYNKIIHSY